MRQTKKPLGGGAGELRQEVSKQRPKYNIFPNKCQLNKAIRISSWLYLGIIGITALVLEVLR